MLHWFHRSIHKHLRVWFPLIGCSLLLHTLFLAIVFVGYRDQFDELIFNMHNRQQIDCEVMVMLEAQPKQVQRVTKQPVKQAAQAKQVAPKTAFVQEKKVPQKKVIPQPKKVTKPVGKPIEKKIAPKKELAKPVQQKSKAQTVEKKPVVQEQSAKAMSDHVAVAQDGVVDTSKIIVSYRDAQAAYRYQELYQELANRWHPPHGVPDGCACSVMVEVDGHGVVKRAEITTSSNILMFDVQVRATILAIEWPRWAWGATFPITLKA
ncbi:MAG TPA: hypothetical protein PLU71_02015 [Candidatus Dependentiae bacterium]|nr:hypothetical protein [Candidatus Dependentiae bacterium]HRQ62607.1 hypothetical protein [Candidatus Dependentiae bacterium]